MSVCYRTAEAGKDVYNLPNLVTNFSELSISKCALSVDKISDLYQLFLFVRSKATFFDRITPEGIYSRLIN